MVLPKTAEVRATSGVQVIARAAEILRALQSAPSGLTQAELGERLDLAKSTLHRILGALEEEGLVATTGSRPRYRLGPAITRMAAGVQQSLIGELHPLLQELSGLLDETVDLSLLDGTSMRFADQVTANQRLRAVSAIGDSFPLHCTANGKAVLAELPTLQARALLPQRLPALTTHTLTTAGQLQAELAEVRAHGVAYDREEHTDGICAIGIALGEIAGERLAISVPMPAQRFYGREEELRVVLQDRVQGYLRTHSLRS